MKMLIRLFLILFMLGTFASRSQAAPYTNYLDEAATAISATYGFVTNALANNPPAPEKAQLTFARNALGKALKGFQKPSTSVATDYNMFIAVATPLMPLLDRNFPAPEIGVALTNAYASFVTEAALQSFVLSSRVAAITPFQPVRRAASNQVANAQRSIGFALSTTNIQLGIISIKVAFGQLKSAAKLTAKAEAKQGFAPDQVAGLTLQYQDRFGAGEIRFNDEASFTETSEEESNDGNYEYNRTALSKAILKLHHDAEEVSTVTLTFTSATAGRFTFRSVGPDGTESGTGTFTVAPTPTEL